MIRYIFLLGFLSWVSVTSAQVVNLPNPDLFTDFHQTNTQEKYWGNVIDDLPLSSVFFVSNASLFPDSTVKQLYPGPVIGGKPTYELGYTYLHAAGQIIDPKYLTSPVYVNKFNRYTLDSTAVYFRYTRRVAALDTLLIQVYGNDQVERYQLTDAEGIVRDKCGRIACDPVTHKPVTAARTIKYVLSDQDTSSGENYRRLTFPAQLEIPADGIAAVIFSFIPGYAYHANDTLQQDWFPAPVNKMNQFQILTYNDQSKYKLMMFNNGIFLTREFTKNPAAWGHRMIPGNIYTDAFRYTYVDFHVTVLNTDVQSSLVNEPGLYPNPASLSETITISTPGAFNGKMEVLSLNGEMLYSENIQINSGGYKIDPLLITGKAGVYLLRFSNEQTVVTQRLLLH